MTLIDLITEVIESCLNTHKFVDTEEDIICSPESFYEAKYRIISACIAALISKKVSSEAVSNINDVKITLNKIIPENKFALAIQNLSKEEASILENCLITLSSKEVESLSIMDFYEELISTEFEPFGGAIINKISKSRTKRQGSYFTPHELSFNCTRIAIDRYIEKKVGIQNFSYTGQEKQRIKSLLLKSTFADFSSGPGSFLVAVLKYYKSYVEEKAVDSTIALNIYAIDVDYIALEIAKYEVCAFFQDFSLFTKIKDHFVCGNPLIKQRLMEESKRIMMFNKGYIYHEDIGFDLSNISEKFDIILGNPPWEKVRFEDKHFFSHLCPSVVSINKKNLRQKKIVELKNKHPDLYSYYESYKYQIQLFTGSKITKQRFPLSSNGEINTYALFTELSLQFRKKEGFIGLLVKSSLVTSKANQKLFSHLVNNEKIVLVADYINAKKIFNIDSRERFCYILLDDQQKKFKLTMACLKVDDLINPSRYIDFSKEDLSLINPDTGMLPNTSDALQISFLKTIIQRNPAFSKIYPTVRFGRIVHFTLHSDSIYKENKPNTLPVYEGKFFHQFDSKYSDFSNMTAKEKYGSKSSSKLIDSIDKNDRNYAPKVRYFIENNKWNELTRRFREVYSLMWRSLTSATNKRTCIATIMPHMPSSQSVQLLQTTEQDDLILLCAIFNSLVFDYVLRIKLNGIDLTQTIIKQMPVPPKTEFSKIIEFCKHKKTIKDHIISRVGSLYYNDARLDRLFAGHTLEEKDRDRDSLINEIDILIGVAYGINSDTFNSIIDNFNGSLSKKRIQELKELVIKTL